MMLFYIALLIYYRDFTNFVEIFRTEFFTGIMKKNLLIASITIFLLIVATGCNNDVFVSKGGLPEFSEVTIESDGGQWSVVYSRKDLVGISLNGINYDERKYLKYLDENYKELEDNCPVEEIADIVFENPKRYFTIGFLGDMIYVRCGYNCGEEISPVLNLEYAYGETKQIKITFTAGEPLEPLIAFYQGEPEFEEDFEKISRKTSFNNGSSLTQYFEFDPYVGTMCSYEVTTKQTWAEGQVLQMPVLHYHYGYGWEHLWQDGVVIGEQRSFPTEEFQINKIKVEVPPNTKATVLYVIHYTKATQNGTVGFYNRVVESSADVDFTCTSIYPTSCDYTVSYTE